MSRDGGFRMNDEVKKVYGKVIEVKEDSIVVDPVFGSKIEIFYDIDTQRVQLTEENVNIEYQGFPQPKLVQIVGLKEETVDEAGLKKIEAPDQQLQMKIPEGERRKVRGKLTKSTVSPDTNIGSVFLELEKLNLEMIYSRISHGKIPEIGTLCTVTIVDGKIPRILEISTNNEEELWDPIYTPFPDDEISVRWPVACMGCGNTDYKELKHSDNIWVQGFITGRTKEKSLTKGDLAKAYVIGGVPGLAAGVAYKAIKERPKGPTGIEAYMEIELYQCPNCFDKKNSYKNFMTIEIDPSNLNLIFQFNNERYAEFFYSYNPGRILAKTMKR
jgi:hypothetical protein